MCPKDLIAAKHVAKEVKRINKKYERVWYKENHNIPNFIFIYVKNFYASSSQMHE